MEFRPAIPRVTPLHPHPQQRPKQPHFGDSVVGHCSGGSRRGVDFLTQTPAFGEDSRDGVRRQIRLDSVVGESRSVGQNEQFKQPSAVRFQLQRLGVRLGFVHDFLQLRSQVLDQRRLRDRSVQFYVLSHSTVPGFGATSQQAGILRLSKHDSNTHEFGLAPIFELNCTIRDNPNVRHCSSRPCVRPPVEALPLQSILRVTQQDREQTRYCLIFGGLIRGFPLPVSSSNPDGTMLSRKLITTMIAALFVIVNAATVNASGWQPSPKPASSVTQTAFQEPLSAPAFESDDGATAPPLFLPIPDSDPAHKTEDSAVGGSEATDSVALDVPNFEPEDGDASEESEASSSVNDDKSAVTKETGDTIATTDRNPAGKSGLKLSDAEEDESDDVFDPSEWIGRWNESSMDWVLRNGSDGIGFFSLTADTPSWEFDPDSRKEGLETDFGTGIHFVDGPGHSGSDLPPRLFDIFWNTRFKAETDYGFGIDANFKIGLFTDFEDSVREGWRFPGRVLAYGDIWRSNSEIGRVVAGFEYLDLEQTEILPAGGIIFEPNPDTKVDLYFPRPQIRLRGDKKESGDQWMYLRGEYHGSAWAVERTTGNADLVSLTEYRATVGLETIPSDREESSSFAGAAATKKCSEHYFPISNLVIPAQAGNQQTRENWFPACAGMTKPSTKRNLGSYFGRVPHRNSRTSSKNPILNLSMDVGQAEVSALESDSQLLVIDAE